MVIGIIAAIRRDKEFVGKYCHTFEIVLCVVLSHSILLFNICQSLAFRFQKINERSPSPIGANVQQIQVLEDNIDKLLDLLLLQTLFCGIFIVHYSLNTPMTYQLSISSSVKDDRKKQLDKRGFVITNKNPYVYNVVISCQKALLSNNSTDENIHHRPSTSLKDAQSSGDHLIEPLHEVKYQCDDCNNKKKDIILLPCHHFEACSTCLFRDSQFGVDHKCPTCNTVHSNHEDYRRCSSRRADHWF